LRQDINVREITFTVESSEDGGFVARWDDSPGRGGITTQGDTLAELQRMVADAVNLYFEGGDRPRGVRLHFLKDPVVPIA
jgi:predicted RNase H-like HicB family nuclease